MNAKKHLPTILIALLALVFLTYCANPTTSSPSEIRQAEESADSDDEPVDDEPVDDEPAGDEPADDEPADDEPVDDEPVDDEPVDDEPVDDEPVDDEPVDDEPVDDEPVDETSVKLEFGDLSAEEKQALEDAFEGSFEFGEEDGATVLYSSANGQNSYMSPTLTHPVPRPVRLGAQYRFNNEGITGGGYAFHLGLTLAGEPVFRLAHNGLSEIGDRPEVTVERAERVEEDGEVRYVWHELDVISGAGRWSGAASNVSHGLDSDYIVITALFNSGGGLSINLEQGEKSWWAESSVAADPEQFDGYLVGYQASGRPGTRIVTIRSVEMEAQ